MLIFDVAAMRPQQETTLTVGNKYKFDITVISAGDQKKYFLKSTDVPKGLVDNGTLERVGGNYKITDLSNFLKLFPSATQASINDALTKSLSDDRTSSVVSIEGILKSQTNFQGTVTNYEATVAKGKTAIGRQVGRIDLGAIEAVAPPTQTVTTQVSQEARLEEARRAITDFNQSLQGGKVKLDEAVRRIMEKLGTGWELVQRDNAVSVDGGQLHGRLLFKKDDTTIQVTLDTAENKEGGGILSFLGAGVYVTYVNNASVETTQSTGQVRPAMTREIRREMSNSIGMLETTLNGLPLTTGAAQHLRTKLLDQLRAYVSDTTSTANFVLRTQTYGSGADKERAEIDLIVQKLQSTFENVAVSSHERNETVQRGISGPWSPTGFKYTEIKISRQ